MVSRGWPTGRLDQHTKRNHAGHVPVSAEAARGMANYWGDGLPLAELLVFNQIERGPSL